VSKSIIILGAGESGVGAAKLALSRGYVPFVSDAGNGKASFLGELSEAGIDFEVGGHDTENWPSTSTAVKSPGIPDSAPVLEYFRERKIEIISEIEFASRHASGRVVAITGTNGKTTTTALIYRLLTDAGINATCVGNIGTSWARDIAERTTPAEVTVVEASSFQLDGTTSFRPDIAVLLNITPDHLNRYGNDFQRYVDSKFRILQNQTQNDFFIYWADDPVIKKELKKRKINTTCLPFSSSIAIKGPGAFIKNEKIIFNNGKNKFDMTLEQLALQGKHNTRNSMAAGVAAHLMEIRKESIKQSLSDFQNISHRLEYVASIHGITFINDSKATNVNSTWYALEYMDKPTVWIVGGVDKGNNYDLLKPLVGDKVKAIVCLGLDNKNIHEAFDGLVETMVDTESAAEAVATAYYLAEKGDAVLLSPACASFDLFENYEDRGNQFKEAVNAL